MDNLDCPLELAGTGDPVGRGIVVGMSRQEGKGGAGKIEAQPFTFKEGDGGRIEPDPELEDSLNGEVRRSGEGGAEAEKPALVIPPHLR